VLPVSHGVSALHLAQLISQSLLNAAIVAAAPKTFDGLTVFQVACNGRAFPEVMNFLESVVGESFAHKLTEKPDRLLGIVEVIGHCEPPKVAPQKEL
jgi:hypothetical protein